MSVLVSLSEAKAFLDVIHSGDDDKVQMLLDGAESEAEAFLGFDFEETSSEEEYPAVLILLMGMYEGTPEEARLLRQAAEIKLAPWREGLGC